jgi:hypothetical protein
VAKKWQQAVERTNRLLSFPAHFLANHILRNKASASEPPARKSVRSGRQEMSTH